MAKWIILHEKHDYQHASRAITAFEGGKPYYQPDHIADPLIELGYAKQIEKPKRG